MLDDDAGLAELRAASSSAKLHRLLITGHLSSRGADYRVAAGRLRHSTVMMTVGLQTPHSCASPDRTLPPRSVRPVVKLASWQQQHLTLSE